MVPLLLGRAPWSSRGGGGLAPARSGRGRRQRVLIYAARCTRRRAACVGRTSSPPAADLRARARRAPCSHCCRRHRKGRGAGGPPPWVRAVGHAHRAARRHAAAAATMGARRSGARRRSGRATRQHAARARRGWCAAGSSGCEVAKEPPAVARCPSCAAYAAAADGAGATQTVPGRLAARPAALLEGRLPLNPPCRLLGRRTPGANSRLGGGASGRQYMHSGFQVNTGVSPGMVVAWVPHSSSGSDRDTPQWTHVHVCGPSSLVAGALPKFMYTMGARTQLPKKGIKHFLDDVESASGTLLRLNRRTARPMRETVDECWRTCDVY